jgi:hypothetical protein
VVVVELLGLAQTLLPVSAVGVLAGIGLMRAETPVVALRVNLFSRFHLVVTRLRLVPVVP